MSKDRFDSWLDDELHRVLGATGARPAPPARYADLPARGWRPLRVGAGAGAAVGAKLATGFVVAAFAIGVTGTALTGTPNPAAWGDTVTQVVDQCKALAQEEGIGGCVSAVAQQHGEAVASAAREEHQAASPSPSASASPHPTPGERHEDRSPSTSPSTRPEPSHRPTPRPSPSHTPEHGDRSPRPGVSGSPSPLPSHRPDTPRSPEPDARP